MVMVLLCASSAARTYIINNSVIAADRISVYRMIYGAVTDAVIVHAADNCFEGLEVLRRISVHLYVADVACVCQIVVWSFNLDFLRCRNREIHRDMEAVCVVSAVRYALDFAVTLAVNTGP